MRAHKYTHAQLRQAGELCEHLVMVLEGMIVAYHRSTVMKTYEAGSLAGTQGLTADNAKFMFTLIAEEDSYLALLPHHRLLSYIQGLECAR